MSEKKRIAIYCRIGTADSLGKAAYATQQQRYAEIVKAHDNWELAGMYTDFGVKWHSPIRPELSKLLYECRQGKFDLIITESVSDLHKNLVGAIAVIQDLWDNNPPVGVYFCDTRLNTIAADEKTMLTHILTWTAIEESRQKADYVRGIRRGQFNCLTHKTKENA